MRVIRVKEAAALLHVSPNKVYDMALRGEIPAFRIGRAWRFEVEQLEKWVEEQGRQRDLEIPRALRGG